MKRIFNIALIAALLVSCNNFDNEGISPDTTTGDEIQFYAGEDTKTTYFEDEGLGIHWEEGDLIPIIARSFVEGKEKRTRGYYKAEQGGASTNIIHSSGATEFDWNTTVGEIAISEQNTDFVALHCGAKQTASTTIYNGITVYSSYNQTQLAANNHAHIGDYVVLASDIVTREVGNTSPVNFQFTNCMSVVELTIKGDAAKKISNITLSSSEANLGFNVAYLSVEDWTTSADVTEVPFAIYPNNGNANYGSTDTPDLSNEVSLSLDEPAALSAEGTKFYFVLMPGNHNAGAITLTATATDNTVATVKMGAISLEKNKVYRSSLTLSNFKAKEYADIEHYFSNLTNTYNSVVKVENGVTTPISDRSYYVWNMPVYTQGMDISTINATSYTEVNRIKAITAGFVYILTGHSALVTDESINELLVSEGWIPVTAMKGSSDKDMANYESSQIYYGTKEESSSGTLTLYEREMIAGEEYDLTKLYSKINKFQGIRPVAKSITNKIDNTLVLDFTTQPNGWKSNGNFASVVQNALEGKTAFPLTAIHDIDLDFSYSFTATTDESTGDITITNIGGSGWSSGKYLLVHFQNSGQESVGMPYYTNHKLSSVTMTTNKGKNKVNVCMSSTPAHIIENGNCIAQDAVSVSGDIASINFTANATHTFTISDSKANTPYYLFGSGSSLDMRIFKLHLTYEKAE